MKEIITNFQLNNLADLLIKQIKNRKEIFNTFTIVFPNMKMQQWFKAYWLKTQDDVLMNVSFVNIDEMLINLIKSNKNYRLLSKETLKSLIIKHLSNINLLDEETKNYLYDNKIINPIKLYDLANELSSLFIEYENDLFELEESSFQKKLYDEVLKDATNNNLATLSYIYNNKIELNVMDETLFFFGFITFNKLHEKIINEYSNNANVIIYMLKHDPNYNKDYYLFSSPSKLREIEVVHSSICSLLKNDDVSYSDFLILANDISEYEAVITRTFNQDNINFLNVPFVINDVKKEESEVSVGLKKLFEIFNKDFYTRLDFFELINNKDIMLARNISKEDIDNFASSIIAMNIYRDKPTSDDWDYVKKRVLFSKISNLNDINENIIELSDKSYLPYSNISFNDESIVKFVKLIDDIKSFKDVLSMSSFINETNLPLIKKELEKWFSIKDENDFETNKYYKNVLSTINSWITLKIANNLIPLNTFFYMLFDIAKATLMKKGDYFTKGVTFASFDIDAILQAKYVFFLNASSTSLPVIKVKSEFDLRPYDINDIAKQKEAFFIQYQNTSNFNVSYVNKDLKTDEEFYKSSFIMDLLAINKINEVEISLDETRPWNELFTKKSYKNKAYYLGLLKDEVEEDKKSIVNPSSTLLKKVKAKDMATYLEEPLKYKATFLFGRKDELDENIKKEYEPFALDNLRFAELTKRIIAELLISKKDELDSNTLNQLYINLNLEHKLPDINESINISSFNHAVEASILTAKDIKEKINDNDYDVISLSDLILTTNNTQWVLTCPQQVCISTNECNRTYFELKRLPKQINDSDYLFLYIASLMDVAKLENKTYTINLYRGKNKTFSLTPNKAKELLEKIYLAMNDFNENYFMSINLINDKKITLLDHIIDKITAKDGSPWSYFDDKALFDYENQLGYNYKDFENKYQQFKKKHLELIEFIKKESEGEAND